MRSVMNSLFLFLHSLLLLLRTSRRESESEKRTWTIPLWPLSLLSSPLSLPEGLLARKVPERKVFFPFRWLPESSPLGKYKSPSSARVAFIGPKRKRKESQEVISSHPSLFPPFSLLFSSRKVILLCVGTTTTQAMLANMVERKCAKPEQKCASLN